MITEQHAFERVITILKPFVKDPATLSKATMETSLLKDLEVNSARLVDVVLEIEDKFDISVSDKDADTVRTVGDAVSLVVALSAA
jgi:acyl carrier protein